MKEVVSFIIVFLLALGSFSESAFALSEDELSALKKYRSKNQDKNKIYQPIKNKKTQFNSSLLVERDSEGTITVGLSVSDELKIKMCYDNGVYIAIHPSFNEAIEDVLIDNVEHFDKKINENSKGVYIKLIRDLKSGVVQAPVRIIRKSNGTAFSVRIYGEPCPPGDNKYPKIVYIEDKPTILHRDTKVLTPEDKIIGMTKGYSRTNNKEIDVKYMVMNSNDKWAVMSLFVKFPQQRRNFNYEVRFLDRFQVNEINSSTDYLPLHSKKATKLTGEQIARFSIKVNITKKYILTKRWVWLFLIDNQRKEYQQVKVDLSKFLNHLKDIGFGL
jgi:hypothetical protein